MSATTDRDLAAYKAGTASAAAVRRLVRAYVLVRLADSSTVFTAQYLAAEASA